MTADREPQTAAGRTLATPDPHDACERDMLELIDQRDRAEDAADALAYAIAPMDVIGEHSSGNDPWANALEFAAGGYEADPEP